MPMRLDNIYRLNTQNVDTGVRLYLPSEDIEDSRATQYKYTNLNDFIWLSFIPITGIGYLATILFNDDAKRL